MLIRKATISLLTALIVSAANHAQSASTNRVEAGELQAVLEGPSTRQCPGLASLRSVAINKALLELYQRSGFVSKWETVEQLTALQHELSQLANDGLILADYSYALNALPATEACDELRVSSEYLLALEHLSLGRLSQESFSHQWYDTDAIHPTSPALVELALRGLRDMPMAFDEARPGLQLYRELRDAYARMDKQPAPRPLLPPGATMKPGLEDPRLPQLMQRLQAEGYLAQAGQNTLETQALRYEADVAQAVMRFQADHGLQVDGLVGRQTLAALNVSPLQRVQQVRINLERLRWLSNQRSDYMLLVNIAGGDIRLYRGEDISWQSLVMSGRAERPTPALISRVNRITLNPSWTVPPTILQQDKLPQIRRNPNFLEENDLQVLDFQGRAVDPDQVNWNNPAGIMLRQPPGPNNPLGKVAFRFPSPFAIYLHDTPSQKLFANSARNVSSGCVRVQNAEGLAYQLLKEKTAAELQQIARLQESGETHEINLQDGPQLIIAYWTAEAGSKGRVRYLPDPYNMDPALMTAFNSLEAAYLSVAQETTAQAAHACGG